MTRLCLQLLVIAILSARTLALVRQLRRHWGSDDRLADDPAHAFRRELRRRGLLSAPPRLPPPTER
ncbi:MAG: hypothetical protein ACK5FE_09140 [Cyanobacteriota bacterium]